MKKKIKVLIIDDSEITQKIFEKLISSDPELEVVGKAKDAFEAKDMILQLNPDVLTLDINMPKMDGITFLKILMKKKPLPTIIVSAFTPRGSSLALEALGSGALDVICKPNESVCLSKLKSRLLSQIHAIANVTSSSLLSPKIKTLPVIAREAFDPEALLLFGASTGGISSLRSILPRLPTSIPPICIVQHIPENFSTQLAETLNSMCAFDVKEAQDYDILRPGLALIAPGGWDMTIDPANCNRIRLTKIDSKENDLSSVDALFKSAAKSKRKQTVGVILSGMGKDGAEGLLALKNIGCRTFAEDESTCKVYGMPFAAHELGAVEEMVPLAQLAPKIIDALPKRNFEKV